MYMYTDEGDRAVERALASISLATQDRTKVWNRDTLEAVAKPFIEGVEKIHEEISDTEPRGHIADFLDNICEENGWAYDPWAGYDW